MGLVEQSSNAGEILGSRSILGARIDMALQLLRLDVARELISLGVVPSEKKVSAVIAGLTPDVLANELAKRT